MVGEHIWYPAAVAIGLAAVHLLAGRLRWLDVIPRSRFLSMSGGVSVAYVFVHVLPVLEATGSPVPGQPRWLTAEEHRYLLALLGFVLYYGLERYARAYSSREPTEASAGVFWLHLGSFAVYNAAIGYLLFHREVPGVGNLVLFAVAMALHFLVNDHGLRDHHAERYHRIGRWLLAGAVVAGALAGATTAVDRDALEAVLAVLAGGIVLNSIKEELPPERESRFWAFAVGATGYAALLLAV